MSCHDLLGALLFHQLGRANNESVLISLAIIKHMMSEVAKIMNSTQTTGVDTVTSSITRMGVGASRSTPVNAMATLELKFNFFISLGGLTFNTSKDLRYSQIGSYWVRFDRVPNLFTIETFSLVRVDNGRASFQIKVSSNVKYCILLLIRHSLFRGPISSELTS